MLAVEPKAWGLDFMVVEDSEEEPELYELVGDAAVVTICGPLFSKRQWFADSYEDIQCRFDAALACAEAKRVILRIDSPGGDVPGCFELAGYMREMSAAAGKDLIAFSDGRACSAAYALASAADKFFITPTATIGSIGVYEVIADVTAQDKAMGVRFIFAASGERKLDGNPHVTPSEGAIESIQANVRGLADLFFELVAAHRGMPAAQVAALEAGTFFGANAVALGLADGTMTWPELVSGSQGETGDKQMAQGGTKSGTAQAKSDSITSSLMKIIDGEDENQSKAAKRMLAKYLNESAKDGEEDDKEPKEEGKKAEGEEKEPAEGKKATGGEDSSKGMKAAAASTDDMRALLLEQGRKIQALTATITKKDDDEKRAAILATRPDLAPEAVKALAVVATKDLEAVLNTFPKIPNAAAASSVMGTRGDTQGLGQSNTVAPHVADVIDVRMGLRPKAAAVGNVAHELHLGVMTADQAREHLKKLEGKGV